MRYCAASDIRAFYPSRIETGRQRAADRARACAAKVAPAGAGAFIRECGRRSRLAGQSFVAQDRAVMFDTMRAVNSKYLQGMVLIVNWSRLFRPRSSPGRMFSAATLALATSRALSQPAACEWPPVLNFVHLDNINAEKSGRDACGKIGEISC